MCRAEVCRCTFGLFAESPRSTRLSRQNGNNHLKSNPFGHDKAPEVKAFGNWKRELKSLEVSRIGHYTEREIWVTVPLRTSYLDSKEFQL
jgi:hypothetical protein